MTAIQPPTLTILYVYCTGGTECLNRTPGSHSVCAVRTLLEVDRNIFSIRKEPMLSGSLNAQSILPCAGSFDVMRQSWEVDKDGIDEVGINLSGRWYKFSEGVHILQ